MYIIDKKCHTNINFFVVFLFCNAYIIKVCQLVSFKKYISLNSMQYRVQKSFGKLITLISLSFCDLFCVLAIFFCDLFLRPRNYFCDLFLRPRNFFCDHFCVIIISFMISFLYLSYNFVFKVVKFSKLPCNKLYIIYILVVTS